jgi:hypothetical protein
MDKFLEKIQMEIEKKMLACMKGESIVKPFAKIYNEVRENTKSAQHIKCVAKENRSAIYSDGEASIYATVVQQFLEEHPELKANTEKSE